MASVEDLDPEWAARFVDADGLLRTPPLNGAVPDQRVQFDDVAQYIRIFTPRAYRIGSPHGEFLFTGGGPAASMATLPSDMHRPWYHYSFTGYLPPLWTIETGTVAPIFGSPGGARYVVVYSASGSKLNVFELCDVGVLNATDF